VSGGQNSTSTHYYATFELAGGARREFKMHGSEYGLLGERDKGQLSYQGTRYQGFQRDTAVAEPASLEVNPLPTNRICSYCGSAIPVNSMKCGGCGSTWHPTA